MPLLAVAGVGVVGALTLETSWKRNLACALEDANNERLLQLRLQTTTVRLPNSAQPPASSNSHGTKDFEVEIFWAFRCCLMGFGPSPGGFPDYQCMSSEQHTFQSFHRLNICLKHFVHRFSQQCVWTLRRISQHLASCKWISHEYDKSVFSPWGPNLAPILLRWAPLRSYRIAFGAGQVGRCCVSLFSSLS